MLNSARCRGRSSETTWNGRAGATTTWCSARRWYPSISTAYSFCAPTDASSRRTTCQLASAEMPGSRRWPVSTSASLSSTSANSCLSAATWRGRESAWSAAASRALRRSSTSSRVRPLSDRAGSRGCRAAATLPIDDSPFTNDFYMPGYSEYFSRLDQETRESLNRQHVLTSDGISEGTLRQIYQRIYAERFIHGNPDLVSLYPNRNVIAVSASDNGWSLNLYNSNHPGVLGQVDVDVVVWATGFRSVAPDFLAPIADRLEREGDEYRIDSDFAVRWDGPSNRSIFLQNAALRQRGLADKNLSLIAWRSQRIIDRIRCVRSDDPVPSFIEWSAKLSSDESVG